MDFLRKNGFTEKMMDLPREKNGFPEREKNRFPEGKNVFPERKNVFPERKKWIL